MLGLNCLMNELLHRSNLALTNGNQPELVTFVNSVVDFIMANENGRVFLNWDRNALMQAVAYNMAKGTFLYKTVNKKIDGLFMWYRCNDGDEHNPWMEDNPKGDSIYLSILLMLQENFLSICRAWFAIFLPKVPSTAKVHIPIIMLIIT